MKKENAIREFERVLRRDHKARSTVESYTDWIGRFFDWHAGLSSKARARFETREDRATAFLSYIAPRVGVLTQKQALCALVYFHREVVGEALGDLPAWVNAKRPRRLPQWVTAQEAAALFQHMKGPARLIGELMFGSGLRLREAFGLRVKDLDFERLTITVKEGKGFKDRVTVMPSCLVGPLRDEIVRSRALFEEDRRNGTPGVALPESARRKYPRHGERWEWHWVFPSGKLSTDPETKIVRRHHYHPDMLNKAVTVANRKAAIPKRLTSHAFRHGFATSMLLGGMPIHELKELMGHADIKTTSIYLHCLPNLEERAVSPLDAIRNVTPMRQGAAVGQLGPQLVERVGATA